MENPDYCYYLQENAYKGVGEGSVVDNLKELNEIVVGASEGETFVYSEALWNVKMEDEKGFDSLFSSSLDMQFTRMVLPSLFNRIFQTGFCIEDKEDLDIHFPNSCNAFWGVCFTDDAGWNLNSLEKYAAFKMASARKIIKCDTFARWAPYIFSSLYFCEEFTRDITTIRDSSTLEDIIGRLINLNRFAEQWTNGGFQLEALKQYVGNEVSTESETVVNNPQLSNFRTFQLPSGEYVYFEYHIKLGDTRIYIHCDAHAHRVYVGYVGKHLPTKKF